ncbi:glycosyltransferase [Halosegnis longus]|uniref:glycosyltransferase n=1 Tax=Halosegnis longus TaxID=2216012 RepID=UPI00096AA155|nr:glycosyltransferase [Salella cibi]
MKFVGYYPGIDFGDSSQFGRVIHTQNFIQSYHSAVDDSAVFIVGNKDDYEHTAVRELGFGNTLVSKLARDVIGFLLLLKIVFVTDEQVALYCRDSPYVSKTILGLFPSVYLILEINGLAKTEIDQATVSTKIFYWIRDKSRQKSTLLVCVSQGIKEDIQERYPGKRIAVIENGVDTSVFSPETSSDADLAEWTVCYVGGLQSWQGVDQMMDIISWINEDIYFYVVGGTESRRRELCEYAKQLGIDERVEFTGRVSHSKVPCYINRADVCFGPFNRSRQASPMKIYEYLACGKQVILVNKEGLEFVEDYPGVHRLSPDNSSSEIATYVTEVLSDSSPNSEGREYVIKHHSWNTVTSSIQSLIEKNVS